MGMKIVEKEITTGELKEMARKMFGDFVKAVVDTEKEKMVIDGELHSDEEALLLEKGSRQEDLWGINLYPEIEGEDWIDFDSMINLRPSRGNLSRGVDNPKVKEKIREIVNKLVKR